MRLNRQTEQLNALVEQVRNTQTWLEEREAKLQQWERMMTRAELLAADTRSKRYEDESLALHLETMRKFETELDQDITLLGEFPAKTVINLSNTVRRRYARCTCDTTA